MDKIDSIVVGAGPNGLAAAITLAQAGRSVRVYEATDSPGGGLRTSELTLPGYLHDVCSAIQPLAAASPFFNQIDLASRGLRLIQPDIAFAHPLDHGRAGLVYRSLQTTIDELGSDGRVWKHLVGWLSERWNTLAPDILSPLVSLPGAPISMVGFGARSLPSATAMARLFKTEEAKSLFAGCAAHSFLPLSTPLTSSFGLLLGSMAHVAGWPIVKGGSERISDSMVSLAEELGVEIVCNRPVRSLSDLPDSTAILFNTTPEQVINIASDRLPDRYLRRLRKFKRGPGVFKLDYALSEPIPWTNPGCSAAGTVHVGGPITEIATAEAEVNAGRHPEKPFVILAQQSNFDPTRAPDGGHTLWAYCHVPNGSPVDMSVQIENQIERFAPGFRDTIIARHSAGPRWYQSYNENYRGGDIGGGSHSGSQLFARPVLSPHPYRTPNPRLFICSASTPPGAGVHGMAGYLAARDVLNQALR